MQPGNIILLNGASSSGKTTLAKALQNQLQTPYLHLGLDHFLTTVPQHLFVVATEDSPEPPLGWQLIFDNHVDTFATEEGRTGYTGASLKEIRLGLIACQLLAGFYSAVAALSRSGLNIIVDDVIYDRSVLHSAVAALTALPVLFVGVHCPLPILLERERTRGDRAGGGAAYFHPLVHAHTTYDLEIDTSLLDPNTAAAQIRHHVEHNLPGTGLSALHSP